MKRILMTVLVCALGAGCASGGGLGEQMAAWQGLDADVAIGAWGEPQSQQTFGDGAILLWRDLSPDSSAVVVCERMLAVDADGIVTGWRWRGNACPTLAPRGSAAVVAAAN